VWYWEGHGLLSEGLKHCVSDLESVLGKKIAGVLHHRDPEEICVVGFSELKRARQLFSSIGVIQSSWQL
jgi:hypothetical protein